ncbi:hypothetical protein N0V91_000316 [Didymella pomorum]|uniref:Uncharacterized protein n=1 Tax=Didymella pomorum TaxID=749634 RepID=A0A9W8ZQ05_9PLEO|nr:hypothetical protein N0V91_000316 [Didymella pomorum]
MAFRPRRIDEVDDDHVHQSSVSLASIVKSQPNCDRTAQSWRPIQASDLGEARNTNLDGSSKSTDADVCSDTTAEFELRGPFIDRQVGSGTLTGVLPGRLQLRDTNGDVMNDYNIAGIVGASEMAIDKGEVASSAEAARMRLFGNLPDLIRLSEQVGAFDGQIIFIGHPNRDISAHQWSSSPFQWVNIGRYSRSRGKVEGSLASDRLRGVDEPHDTMEYFKLAAENRQALVIEDGHSENQDTVSGPALRAGDGPVGQPRVSQDPPIKTFRINDEAQSGARLSLQSTTHTVLAKDVLEDPFVTAAGLTLPWSMNESGGMTRTSKTFARNTNAPSVTLQFSDPDGLRKPQQYEVANGLTQQAPTPQNFKGPFFTDSMPTTHDPTASLSVHVSEEEKLINWFCDGQRPARQKEYTKSLIAAAVASDKSRHLGAINEASAKSEVGPYANTGPFVRMYENLSEYVEEHCGRGGQSYFTRHWKPAATQLREQGPEQSRSYCCKSSARPSWPGSTMLRPSDRM